MAVIRKPRLERWPSRARAAAALQPVQPTGLAAFSGASIPGRMCPWTGPFASLQIRPLDPVYSEVVSDGVPLRAPGLSSQVMKGDLQDLWDLIRRRLQEPQPLRAPLSQLLLARLRPCHVVQIPVVLCMLDGAVVVSC